MTMGEPNHTKRIAITGCIGSGKSFVCHELARRGIAVYDCDDAAKRLMRTSAQLQQQLIDLVGDNVYIDGVLQKAVLAKFLLASEANKQAINAVVHPAVADDFMRSGQTWLESAILFESGFDRRVPFDHVVCVAAPVETRIARIIARDSISRDRAVEWINRQMPQDEVISRSQFVINNDGITPIAPQIDKLLITIQTKR